MRNIEFMWNGGNTRRFHTMHTIMLDTVGHHSYNVACIIMHLRPEADARLLRAALKHDQTEHIVGDMPAPTKRGLPNYFIGNPGEPSSRAVSFRQAFGDYEEKVANEHGVSIEEDLADSEAWVLKLADSLDGMRFCIQERRMGNRHPKLIEAFSNFHSYVVKLIYGEAPTHEILDFAKAGDFAQPQDIELFKYLSGEWHSVHG